MTDYSFPFRTEPCHTAVYAGSPIGLSCPSCGHTDLVHPGGHNPAIDACLLCKLEITIGQLTPPLPIVIRRIYTEKEEGEGSP